MNPLITQLTQLLTAFHQVFQDWTQAQASSQPSQELLHLQADLLEQSVDDVRQDPSQAFLQVIQLINERVQLLAEGQAMDEKGQNLLQTLQKYDISLNQDEEGLFSKFQQLLETVEPVAQSQEDEETTEPHPEVLEMVKGFSQDLQEKLSNQELPGTQAQQLNDLLKEVAQQLQSSDNLDQLAQHLETQVINIMGLETQEEQDQKAREEYRAIAKKSIAASLAKHGFKTSSDWIFKTTSWGKWFLKQALDPQNMNKLLVVILASTLLLACSKTPKTAENQVKAPDATPQYLDMEANAFQQMMTQQPGTLLDVRTLKEFSTGKIPKAMNIDITQLSFASKVQKLDRKQPVYVYCQIGGRSSFALKQMKELGFTHVYNLKGGLEAWKKAGLPTE